MDALQLSVIDSKKASEISELASPSVFTNTWQNASNRFKKPTESKFGGLKFTANESEEESGSGSLLEKQKTGEFQSELQHHLYQQVQASRVVNDFRGDRRTLAKHDQSVQLITEENKTHTNNNKDIQNIVQDDDAPQAARNTFDCSDILRTENQDTFGCDKRKPNTSITSNRKLEQGSTALGSVQEATVDNNSTSQYDRKYNLTAINNFLSLQTDQQIDPWNFRSQRTTENGTQTFSARGSKLQSISSLNWITNTAIRKIHETTDKLIQRIMVAQTPKHATAERSHETYTPHSFSKNILTREQINELIDLKNVKKMFPNKKRNSTQVNHNFNNITMKHRRSPRRNNISTRAAAASDKRIT